MTPGLPQRPGVSGAEAEEALSQIYLCPNGYGHDAQIATLRSFIRAQQQHSEADRAANYVVSCADAYEARKELRISHILRTVACAIRDGAEGETAAAVVAIPTERTREDQKRPQEYNFPEDQP